MAKNSVNVSQRKAIGQTSVHARPTPPDRRASRTTEVAANSGPTIPRTVTVHVPMRFHKIGGRKLIIAPNGISIEPETSAVRVNNTILKALARAHRWQRILESGKFASINDLARAEKISETYLGRVLRLTLLAPKIVEDIVEGRIGRELNLDRLMRDVPRNWHEQAFIRTVPSGGMSA